MYVSTIHLITYDTCISCEPERENEELHLASQTFETQSQKKKNHFSNIPLLLRSVLSKINFNYYLEWQVYKLLIFMDKCALSHTPDLSQAFLVSHSWSICCPLLPDLAPPFHST